MVGLLMAAGAASPAVAAGQPIQHGAASPSAPAFEFPALPQVSDPYNPFMPGDQNSGDQNCDFVAFSLGPLYSMGPFGPLGPWGSMGPLHGDPDHPCFGGLDKKK
jgi:hypothetical protein